MNSTTFGTAIEAAKKGHKITRSGWNGKDMWLILFSYSFFITVDTEEENPISSWHINITGYTAHIDQADQADHRIKHIGILSDGGTDFYPISDFLLMKTADNKVVPWLASQTDVLAEDWLILPL